MAITTVWQLDMKEVRQMIAQALSLPVDLVIEANQEIDVTKYDYIVTVLQSSQNEIGSQLIFDGNNETEILSSISELTLSVKAYGLNAYPLINQLVMSMTLTPIYQMQRRMKLGYLRASQITTSAVTPDDKVPCAQVDLIFSINNIIKANRQRGKAFK